MKAQVFMFVCLLGLAAEAAVSKGKHKLFVAWQKVTIDQDGRNMFLFFKSYFVSASPIYPGHCVGS